MSLGKISLACLLDFILVHVCMAMALAFAVTFHAILGDQQTAHNIATEFPQYYWHCFWPLSLIFPAVFMASGFYQKPGFYFIRYRRTAIVKGAGLAVLFYLLANYLVFQEGLVSESLAAWFAALLIIAVTLARAAQDAFRRTRCSVEKTTPQRVGDPVAVLIVGGAGYIGSILTRRLLDRGYKVRLLDSLVYGYASIRDIVKHPNLELVVGDCRNIQTVVGAVKGVHTIVHLAAIVGDPACEQDRQTALEVNYAATRMLIEVAKGYRIERFVFASSCSVYGISEELVDERAAVNPVSLYARTKVNSEQALLEARSESFHPIILRLSTVFGHSYRPRFDLVVNLLTAKAYQEKVITIYNGQQWRPFLHVRDVAPAVENAMSAPLGVVSGQIFNVGDPRLNFTLSQVAEKIRHEFPGICVENIDNADHRNYRVSFTKIQNQLGFRSQWSLEDGIRELKSALEAGEVADYRDFYYSNQKFLEVSGISAQADATDARVMAAFAGSRAEAKRLFLDANSRFGPRGPAVSISR